MREKFSAQDLKSIGMLADAMVSDGYVEGGDTDLTVQDVLHTPDLSRFVPEAVSWIIREALEPELVITNTLFHKLRLKAGRSIEIGSIGAIEAAIIPEGQEYPERTPQLDGGDMVAATISKKGLKLMITEEAISDSLFDVISLFLRQAGLALGRLKENLSYQLINEMGQTVYDNAVPANSENGICTGRDITGAQNGTMTAHDLFDMYAYLHTRGFMPDTCIMHPMAWKLFAHDPITREILLSGGVVQSRQLPQGTYAKAWGTGHGGQGARTTATGGELSGANPWTTTLNPLTNSFHIAPKFLPTGLNVIVTPHARYTAAGGKAGTAAAGMPTTDFVMAQSSLCGLLLEKEAAGTEEWADPSRDIRALKIRERYGHAMLEQGKSIGVARDVVIGPHYNFENVNSTSLNPLQDGLDGATTFASL